MDTNFSKAKIFMVTAVVASVFISPSTLLSFAQAQTEFQPVAPSIGAKVPLSYFGPPPSTFQPELVGPLKLLRAGQVDVNANTVTLPLYHGRIKGNSTTGNVTKNIWYVLTDTNDKGNADQLGLNFSPKLTYAAVGQAVRVATLEKDTSLTFNAVQLISALTAH